MRGVKFTVNIYSTEQEMKDFQFMPFELGRMADIISFTAGKTSRIGYYCDYLTAACVLLRRLAAPCRSTDLKMTFGLQCYGLSEVLWDTLRAFNTERGHFLSTFRADLLVQ